MPRIHPPQPRTNVVHDVTVGQNARLAGRFTADLVQDVLVQASAAVGASKTTVSMGEPELLGSTVSKGANGAVIIEDQIEVRVLLTTKREVMAIVDLLDRTHVDNGLLVMNEESHDLRVGRTKGGLA